MSNLKTIIENNKVWKKETEKKNPEYFQELSKTQKPNILFITCSDSRIVPNELTGLEAGEIFVHRNIANLIKKEDTNSMAVIEYAINVLKVKQIIICGHYGCGGVEAVIKNNYYGHLKTWLKPLINLFEKAKTILQKKEKLHEKVNILSEINVMYQVEKLKTINFISENIKNNKLTIHGIVYNFKTGSISTLT